MADQPALVLEDPAVSHGEPVHFSGSPASGSWGEPVAVSQLGFDNDDAAFARAEELALPLVQTTVAAGEGAMPDMGGRMPSLDEVRGTDWKPKPGEPGARARAGRGVPAGPGAARGRGAADGVAARPERPRRGARARSRRRPSPSSTRSQPPRRQARTARP
jgi:hypothetical protein